MQFHLNGFKPCDPHLAEASAQAVSHSDALPAQVDVLIVGCGPAGLTLPALLRPTKGRYGLCDPDKVFCPDRKNGPDIFDLRGIDRELGALVVVRPDQYIAHVLPLDAHQSLAAFFAGFMLPLR